MIGTFVAGCIGAAAPEIVRAYEMRSRRRTLRFNWYYVVVSVAYVLLGGYTASIFPGVSSQFTSMSIGAGLVCVINTMGRVAGRLTARAGANFPKDLDKLGGKGGLRDPLGFPANESLRWGNFWDFSQLL